ncbi:MAG: PAS domain S-box protein [Synechococcales bacterium]|nr:PAS domain S-box protein [Synechococcales bacterium]
MTTEDLPLQANAAQETIYLLQRELIAANNEFIALTLELEERLDQLQATNQRLAQEIAERRRIEAALQANELRFRALVENSSDAILLVSRQGICTYASPSVRRILGYMPTNLEGTSVFVKVHPAERARARADFLSCLASAGAEIPVFCRVRAASGGWRYLEGVSCNRLDDPSVQAIVVNLRDVTERQRSEARIRHLNRTLERKIRLRTAQLQLAYDFEATLKRITDKVRDSLDEAQIMQAAVEELALAIPGSSCNSAIYDLSQRTASVHYEYSRLSSSYQGRTLSISAYPELYDQLLRGETFQFCSLNPNPNRGRIAVLAHPISDNEGVLGDLWLMNQPHYTFRDQDVKLVQQVANQCAIALRQSRLYQAAQAQVEALERLNRLKDDFLSTVSHELRAPMTNIKMSSQMLAIQLPSLGVGTSSSINRYIQILQDECNREISLINDLLDLTRLDADGEVLELAPIRLQQHLPMLTDSFRERISNQQQQLILNIPSDLPDLNSHEKYFNRILNELLHNACKYTPPQERIIVSANIVESPPAAEQPPPASPSPAEPTGPPETPLSRCLMVQVTNTGVEISPKERDRIFDKFYRIPNNDPWKYGGTGLGLALVKKLTERLGCQIQLASEHQQTTFMLLFPLVLPEAETSPIV